MNSPSPRASNGSDGAVPATGDASPVVTAAWELVRAAWRHPEMTLVAVVGVAVVGAIAGWW